MGLESYAALRFSLSLLKEFKRKENLEFLWGQFNDTLDVIEQKWLGDPARVEEANRTGAFNWIVGVDYKPGLADLSAFFELS